MAAARSPLVIHFGQKLRACRARIGTIVKLAGALEMPLGELFGEVNWKPEKEDFTLSGLGDVPVG